MTRKDCLALANALSYARMQTETVTRASALRAALLAHSHCVQGIAQVLANDNPRFDRERFLTACGESL